MTVDRVIDDAVAVVAVDAESGKDDPKIDPKADPIAEPVADVAVAIINLVDAWADPKTDRSPHAVTVVSFVATWAEAMAATGVFPFAGKLDPSPKREYIRGHMALDWYVRTFFPTWLDATGLQDEAKSLASLDPIVDSDTANAAAAPMRAALSSVSKQSANASWATANHLPAIAQRLSGTAIGESAGLAAWDAATCGAIKESAWADLPTPSAACEVIRNVAMVARLAPIVASLQDSALALLQDMINA